MASSGRLLLCLLAFVFASLVGIPSALSTKSVEPPALSSSSADVGGGGQINSNSVLVALIDSHYTELAELVEKALLLPALEDAVARHNVTIFAPHNDALDRGLDPEFKRFLLEPANLPSLQALLLFHVLPTRVVASDSWPSSFSGSYHPTLAGNRVHLTSDRRFKGATKRVGLGVVVDPDAIVRSDGVIHGIDRVLVPRSVEDDFNRRRSLADVGAVFPTGAPELDPRPTRRLKDPPSHHSSVTSTPVSRSHKAEYMAPGSAPASAPSPGLNGRRYDGARQVKDFIESLVAYGGYNEMADMLVNLTSLASEMGRLVTEGYALTVLAPNDEAFGKLTAEQLSEPGAPEAIVYYHLLPEYQTEESMYNAVRRFGKVRYNTLRVPHELVAREADGSVKFGSGEGSAYLFDPDIYADGRISVQGIDAVLMPPRYEMASGPGVAPAASAKKKLAQATKATKPRRGRLLSVACQLLGSFGQGARFNGCK